MRLIDLDEFTKLSQSNVADLSSLDEETDINYVWDMGYIECLKVLDSCHVIKAIPIWWLEMFARKYKICGDEEYKIYHFMLTEWKKWERENENL